MMTSNHGSRRGKSTLEGLFGAISHAIGYCMRRADCQRQLSFSSVVWFVTLHLDTLMMINHSRSSSIVQCGSTYEILDVQSMVKMQYL